MFTGIVEATAPVLAITDGTLVLEKPGMFTDTKEGSSVAVAGACLTVAAMDDRSMTFDVVPETWRRTRLGSLRAGDRVNLERAMRADGRFDGHVVQGHVEGLGRVVEGEGSEGGEKKLVVELPADLMRFVVPKGSIALDGVSLTVAELRGNRVTVSLIPTTLERTTLREIRTGDAVNVETDALIRATMFRP